VADHWTNGGGVVSGDGSFESGDDFVCGGGVGEFEDDGELVATDASE
jgi:hypothetical protein